MSNQHFYERSKFSEFKSNTTYHQLLEMTDDEFVVWARLLRKEVTEQWDEFGNPPVIGKNHDKIISSFGKLKSNAHCICVLKASCCCDTKVLSQ